MTALECTSKQQKQVRLIDWALVARTLLRNGSFVSQAVLMCQKVSLPAFTSLSLLRSTHSRVIGYLRLLPELLVYSSNVSLTSCRSRISSLRLLIYARLPANNVSKS